MARVVAGNLPLDMTAALQYFEIVPESILVATSNHIRISTPFGGFLDFGGVFSYSSTNVYGTITTYAEYRQGQLLYGVDQISVPVSTYLSSSDLRPLVLQGPDTILGGSASDTLVGYDGSDLIRGGAGNDFLIGLRGNDTIYGDEGLDTAVYGFAAGGYTVDQSPGLVRISHNLEGVDLLYSVERLEFSDGTLALYANDPAGQALRLYVAALDREPDFYGLGFHVDNLDAGYSLRDVAAGFVASPEFQSKYGPLSNAAFVERLYQNVLDRGADAGGLSFHVANLNAGLSRADVLIGFSESPENYAKSAYLTDDGIWFA